ncbi:hypothetical protein FXO38_05474 [Capsicum annuum]|nr:hypothetical protein FXO38_05474 [Capsicum annuum]
MPLAIQVWLYEYCLNVPQKIASKVDNRIFQLLNWKTNVPRPPFEYLMDVMFNDDGKSKLESPVEEEAVSKPKSPVKKEAFISKKIFDAFRDEVRQKFKGIRRLVKKQFKLMLKAIEQSKEQFVDKEAQQPNVEDVGLDRSGQHFSSKVVQTLDNIFNGTKISDEKMDETNFSDSQFIILDETLSSLNDYRRESITTHQLATREEELTDEYLNDKKSESVVEDHCQTNKENVRMSSKSELHGDIDLDTEEQITTPPDEQRDESVWPDSQNTIPD